jgi:hypothetical protein
VNSCQHGRNLSLMMVIGGYAMIVIHWMSMVLKDNGSVELQIQTNLICVR